MIDALVRGDDSAYEKEKPTWKRVIHGSAYAKAAHESFHHIVWEAEIFPNARDTLIGLPTYGIRGSKTKQKKRATQDCEISERRNSHQDTKKPRKVLLAAYVEGFLQKNGAAVILSRVGAIKTHRELQKHLLTDETQLYLTTRHHTGVQAASVNAAFAVAG